MLRRVLHIATLQWSRKEESRKASGELLRACPHGLQVKGHSPREAEVAEWQRSGHWQPAQVYVVGEKGEGRYAYYFIFLFELGRLNWAAELELGKFSNCSDKNDNVYSLKYIFQGSEQEEPEAQLSEKVLPGFPILSKENLPLVVSTSPACSGVASAPAIGVFHERWLSSGF
ncbi:hypothetical protein NDU88_003990 [Pleurodeles waltl]|uniref:Uncharacterized protein n=1 Tax=Pleurodeles waltl TaxID=8319 RepID=A0AAV7VEV2_PLEWA|nr:hypothetical protein NDU88_003990 [Pleurodeles waltl]